MVNQDPPSIEIEELSIENLREKYNDFLELCKECVSNEASNQNLNRTPQKAFSC